MGRDQAHREGTGRLFPAGITPSIMRFLALAARELRETQYRYNPDY